MIPAPSGYSGSGETDPYTLGLLRRRALFPQVAPIPQQANPAMIHSQPGIASGVGAAQSATRQGGMGGAPGIAPGQGSTGQPQSGVPNTPQAAMAANQANMGVRATMNQENAAAYANDPSTIASNARIAAKSAAYEQGNRNTVQQATALGMDPSSSQDQIQQKLNGPVHLTDPTDHSTPSVTQPMPAGQPTAGAGLAGTPTVAKQVGNAALPAVAQQDAAQKTATNTAYAAGRGPADPYVVAAQLKLRRLQRPVTARPDLSQVGSY